MWAPIEGRSACGCRSEDGLEARKNPLRGIPVARLYKSPKKGRDRDVTLWAFNCAETGAFTSEG
jgi:hypothetical protein